MKSSPAMTRSTDARPGGEIEALDMVHGATVAFPDKKKRKEGGRNQVNFTIRGTVFSISSTDVLRVTRNVPPSPADGRNKYFIDLHGQHFPIKQVLRLVSGLPSAAFTAQDAHRILSRLGFDIFEEYPLAPGTGTSGRTNGGPTSAGMLAIGDSPNQGDGEIRKLLVVFQTDEDGWEVASCPTLPGCHSQGRTRKEALENVREAVRGYLASLREHDAAPPPSSEFQVIEVRV